LRKSDSEEGSILFCSKQNNQKPNELLLTLSFATTSQILSIKAMVLSAIKSTEGDIPTNITAIKYFEKAKKTLPNTVVLLSLAAFEDLYN
jgi:hypothetical protein